MISIAFFFIAQITAYVLSFAHMPVMAFVGYQLVYFVYDDSRWWSSSVPDLRYSFFSSIMVLAFAFAMRAKGKGNRILAAPSFRWLYLLVIVFSATYINAVVPSLHLQSMEYYIKSVIVVSAGLVLCSDRKSLDYVLIAYVIGATYIGYYIFEVGRNSGDRVDGIGTVDSPDVNGLAAMLVPAAVFALHFFWAAKKPSYRLATIVAGGFIVNALILMNSRGAYLGLAAGAGYFMYRLYISNLPIRALKTKIIATGLAGVLGLFLILDQGAIDRILSMTQESAPSAEQQTGSTRVFFWMAAYRMSLDNPFGQGAFAFHTLSDQYIPDWVDTGGSRRRAPHSTWFQTMAEAGFPGLILILMVVFSSYRMLAKTRKLLGKLGDTAGFFTVIAIEGGSIGYLVSISFIDRMRAEALHWLIMLGAAAYLIYYKNNQVDAVKS